MKVDLDKIKELRDKHFITTRKHPVADLFIHNYTPKAQYDKQWDELTMMCRGLITDSQGNIVARPFKKFFNLQEHQGDLPEGKPEIWSKLDGSLGILYWLHGSPYIATRGSFESDQAKVASLMLENSYKHKWELLDPSKTYLFEIIYPSNRIVVDYGDKKRLVLLAIIDTETGAEDCITDFDWTYKAKHRKDLSFSRAIKTQAKNAEGFVLKWDDGFRLKVKFHEYVRLHRLITQVTARSIWDLLRNGHEIDELLDRVPDEFYEWVKSTKKKLEKGYTHIFRESMFVNKTLPRKNTRKENAELILSEHKELSPVIFRMMDRKPYEEIIWRMLKPKHETPFKVEI